MLQRWTIKVWHDGLGKHRIISGTDKYIVEEKARAQKLEWDKKYQQVLEKEQRQKAQSIARSQQELENLLVEEKQQKANTQSTEAGDVLNVGSLGFGRVIQINWSFWFFPLKRIPFNRTAIL